jgi:transposase
MAAAGRTLQKRMSTARANGHNGNAPDGLSIQEAAERVGVAVTTLRRWAREGDTLAEASRERDAA